MSKDDVPDRLWHYTTTDGLLGILGTGKMWATDAMYLNDSRELLEGADRLAWEAATAVADPTPNPSQVRRLWLDLHRVLGADATVKLPEQGPYVACFCSEGDLLSQWRGYASGSGFAIGFTGPGLQTLAESLRGTLLKVVYDTPKSGDDALFRSSALTVGESGRHIIPAPEDLARFKHRAFREEQEWRLVVSEGSALAPQGKLAPLFRPGVLGVTPYIQIELGPDSLVEVMVGPGGDQELRRLAVERLLASSRIPAVTTVSEAPFRG